MPARLNYHPIKIGRTSWTRTKITHYLARFMCVPLDSFQRAFTSATVRLKLYPVATGRLLLRLTGCWSVPGTYPYL